MRSRTCPRWPKAPGRLVALVVLAASIAAVSVRPGISHSTPPAPAQQGYWMVGADGAVYGFGPADPLGTPAGVALPIAGLAPTPSGHGYWMVSAGGDLFAFGDAASAGSMADRPLNRPVVGMAPTPAGRGYWFVASDGGIFSFGDAGFFGSTGAVRLNRPIVGMAATPSGLGYWFSASDGGIFAFGDATFQGSAAGRTVSRPIVAMAGLRAAAVEESPATATTSPPGTTATGATTTSTAPMGPFDIGLLGDTGYSSANDRDFLETIEHMNTFPLAFSIHDGDIKPPEPECDESRYPEVRDTFNRLAQPLIYTPGDNEWLDCTGKDERLALIRRTFFPDQMSLGQRRIPLLRQAAPHVENARWSHGGVTFVTLHIVGSGDNRADPAEFGPRRKANMAWLRAAFDAAGADGSAGLLVAVQANPFPNETGWEDQEFLDELRELTEAFGQPVVLVHGDTHIHRIDQPWPEVKNFTRVETFAVDDTDYWVRATIDATTPGVFTFHEEDSDPPRKR